MKVAIRADASAAIGLGHLKRCLSLARALRAEGATAVFYLRGIDIDGAAALTREGFFSHVLAQGALVDQCDDAQRFIDTSRPFAPDLVLVDHYGLSAAWHDTVRAATGSRLAAIDDLADRALAVDTLIDHNLSSDHLAKYAGRLPAHAVVLGGPVYALLSPAYSDAPPSNPGDAVDSIGIFMGGTDEAGLSSLALAAVRQDVGYGGAVEIATTSGNPHLARLRAAVAADPATRLSLDQPDLAAFYGRHGLHIGAGGGATWERCCLGAATLGLIAAPNQREVLLPLRDLGAMAIVTAEPPTAADIAPALRKLIADAPWRRTLSERSRGLVDGHGARRVARHLLAQHGRMMAA